MTSHIAEAKTQMRREAESRRRVAWQEVGDGAAEQLADNFVAAMADYQGWAQFSAQSRIIAAYWPMNPEIDCRPLLARLARMGHELALPVVVSPGQPLLFRAWSSGDDLEAGPLGTMAPSNRARQVTPHVILAPLVAFDGECRRLGRGGGYYDRTFAVVNLTPPVRVVSVGLAFEAQKVARVPHGPHDRALDWVITERTVYQGVNRDEP